MHAVAAICNMGTGMLELPADFPTAAAAPDYYSAALILLSRIAWQESRRSG
jgi:hypothetical protein